MIHSTQFYILPGGTFGGAGNDAGSGAELPVTASDIPLPGTKPKVAESRNLSFFCKYLNCILPKVTSMQNFIVMGWRL